MRYASALAASGLFAILSVAQAEEQPAPIFGAPQSYEPHRLTAEATKAVPAPVAQTKPIKLHIQIAEVSLTKARDAGIDPNFTIGDRESMAVLDTMRRNHLLKVLSEIDVNVDAGRSASFAIENAVASAEKDAGERTRRTKVDVQATRLDEKRVQVGHLLIELNERESSPADKTSGGLRPRNTTIDTSLYLETGKPLVITGLVESRVMPVVYKKPNHAYVVAHEYQTLFLITADPVAENQK